MYQLAALPKGEAQWAKQWWMDLPKAVLKDPVCPTSAGEIFRSTSEIAAILPENKRKVVFPLYPGMLGKKASVAATLSTEMSSTEGELDEGDVEDIDVDIAVEDEDLDLDDVEDDVDVDVDVEYDDDLDSGKVDDVEDPDVDNSDVNGKNVPEANDGVDEVSEDGDIDTTALKPLEDEDSADEDEGYYD
jgi:hypothetical protein